MKPHSRGAAALLLPLAVTRRLLDELHALEMRRAAGGGTRVNPIADDLRVREDLVPEPEERDVGVLFLDVITDRRHQLVPLRGIRRLLHLVEGLLEEVVLEVVIRTLAGVEVPNPLIGGAPPGE